MPLLSVSGLSKRFGALRAVHEVSFAVDEGEILGLIGPNGSGKSTTFNCIAGLYRPSAGSIVWPKEIQTREPVLPFPKGHAYAP